MKIKALLVLAFLLILSGIHCQTVNWAKTEISGASSLGTDLTINPAGGIYSCGYFSGSISFDGVYNFTSKGSFDVYISSRDQNGVIQWATRFGGTSADYVRAITTDAAGDIYVIGDFSGTCVFGTTTLTAIGGGPEVFVSKLTPSGSISWVKQFGGASGGSVYGNDITVAPNGNIYITGNFSNLCKFGPTTYLASGTSDAYVVRVTSVGGVIGFLKFSGNLSTTSAYGNSIVSDSNSDIYFTGSFKGATTFGAATLTSNGGSDIYLGKIGGTSGAILWTKKYGGTGDDAGYGLCTDNSSFVYLTGAANGAFLFDGLNLNSSGADDIFVFKSDLNGNPQWIKNAGGAANDIGKKISYNSGGLVLTGDIRNSANFGSNIVAGYGLVDAFISKMNTNGTFIWAISGGSSGNDFGSGVAIDNTAIYANGYYTGTGTFGNLTLSTTAGGTNSEAYVLKTGLCNTNASTITANACNSYVYQSQTYTTSGIYTFTNTNIGGCDSIIYLHLTISNTPTISVNNATICSGQSYTIAPSGANSYTIQGGSFIVNPGTTTSYTIIGASSNGCISSNTATSTIIVNSLPVISVNSGSLCTGNSFTITPSGASTYTFSGGSAVVSPTTSASYSVTGTSSAGCLSSNTAVSSVTVNARPTIFVNSGSVCAGASFTLSPSGASTYTFSGGSAVVSPTTNTSYSVTGTSAAGCLSSNTAVSSVTVNPLPIVSVNSGSICSGNSFTINPTGANTYTVSGGSFVVSPSISTSYTVTGTSSNGCVGSAGAVSNVNVNALPNVSASTNNTLICTGQTATLSANGASTYTWSTSQNLANIAVSPTITTTYTLSGTGVNGCANSFVITQSVSSCTGLQDLNNDVEINIYPNPNNGKFTIRSLAECDIEVVDVLGAVVLTHSTISAMQTIDISNYANGLYFVKIRTSSNQFIIKRIIKN